MTLGDLPFIRYFDYSTNDISQKLAFQLQKDLDELHALDDEFPPKNEFKKTIIIIVDRSLDMMAPFIHEFTYQAMVHDILSSENGISR